jgi:hypothetical protein
MFDPRTVYFAGIVYVACKGAIEILLMDLWNVMRKLSSWLYRMRVVRFDEVGMRHEDFMGVVRWAAADLWSHEVTGFLSKKHPGLTTAYRLPSGKCVYGPIFDNGLERANQLNMFGFGLLCFGSNMTWLVRKSIDGWPVWIVADGFHAFIADEYRVLHQNSARFGNHRPAALVVTLSFTPERVIKKLAARLRLDSSGDCAPVRFRNYYALVRTESKTGELEWISRLDPSPDPTFSSWPNPMVQPIMDKTIAVLKGKAPAGIRRLNVMLQGTFGTGKTYLVQRLADATGSHLVLVTKQSKWSAVLDAIYNVAKGPKILLFDEFDTLFAEEAVLGGGGGAGSGFAPPVVCVPNPRSVGGNDKDRAKDSATGGVTQLLTQGGCLNFRKTCAGLVEPDEEEAIKKSIEETPAVSLQEHHLLALLDGSAFSGYAFPVVCFICTNFPEKIPDRVCRWGRISYRLDMVPHTLESALVHSGGKYRAHIETTLTKTTLTPARLQSMLDTAFVGIDSA